MADVSTDSITGQKRKRGEPTDTRPPKFARTGETAYPGGGLVTNPEYYALEKTMLQQQLGAAASQSQSGQARPAGPTSIGWASKQAYSSANHADATRTALPVPATQVAPEAQQRAQSCDDPNGHFIVQLGSNLTERYKILSSMGEGTFGKVVEAWDRKRKIRVAIKIIRNVPKYRRAAEIEIGILDDIEMRERTHGDSGCVHLRGYFDFRNHVCMVFRKYGLSLFDFMKMNKFRGFRYPHVIDFAYQLTYAVSYLHSMGLVHTDLKPENVLFVSPDVLATFDHTGRERSYKLPASTAIKLIDFGSAVYDRDFHSSVVSTRHYRAPEVVLGIPWSFPCDIWSLGCIFVELLTGEAVFQTHDNVEHLSMMERFIGPLPREMIRRATGQAVEFFDSNFKLRYPELAPSAQSERNVQAVSNLSRIFDAEKELLVNLVSRMMQHEPAHRISAHDALNHPVFEHVRERIRKHAEAQEAALAASGGPPLQ